MPQISTGLGLPDFGTYRPPSGLTPQAPWGVPLTSAMNHLTAAGYTNYGSGTSLDTPPIFTCMALLKPNDLTVGNKFVGVKFDSGTSGFYALAFGAYGAANGQLFMEVGRATQSMKCASGVTPVLFTGQWRMVAYQFNIGGVLADQKLFVGSGASPMTEVGDYDAANYRLGSGAQVSDAAGSLISGDFIPASGFGNPLDTIAFLACWRRALPVAELRYVQRYLIPTPGCVGFWLPGVAKYGLDFDYSGNRNHGTLTGTINTDLLYTPGAPINTWAAGLAA